MSRHPFIISSAVEPEDSLLDISTAPTTPDGSLTFSPVLEALKIGDALEDASPAWNNRVVGNSSLTAALMSVKRQVKNICCIGAGYVGM